MYLTVTPTHALTHPSDVRVRRSSVATGTGPVPLVTLRRQARDLATHRYAIQAKSPSSSSSAAAAAAPAALTDVDGIQGSDMGQLDLYNEPPAATNPNPTVDLSSTTAIFANMDNLTVYHVPAQPAQTAQTAQTARTSVSAAASSELTTSKSEPEGLGGLDGPGGPDAPDAPDVDVFERLHGYASVRNTKLEERRAAQRNKLDPECTFTPALSTNDNAVTPPELLATPSTVAASLGFSMLEPVGAAAGHDNATAMVDATDKPAGPDPAARSAEAVARHVERVRQGGQGQGQGQGQGHPPTDDAGTRVGDTGGKGKATAATADAGAATGAATGAAVSDGAGNELEVLYHPELKHPVRHIKLPRSNKVGRCIGRTSS